MDKTHATVRDLMIEYATVTGLMPPAGTSPRRYLWTDAFAVCNFLELFNRTGDEGSRDIALQLVEQVHTILGRHREDDERRGWISGLDEQAGKNHPTMGGLRIGKKLNERKAEEDYDEQIEWDRDGQYFHYLTKWMHALSRVSRVTGDMRYGKWSIELAHGIHSRFIYTSPVDGRKYMRWKMSIDLSRPLVPAMGQHDPLDGFITYNELQMYAADVSDASLEREIHDLAGICSGQNWATDDPLGLGGLLSDSYRLAQMIDHGRLVLHEMLEDLLASSLAGLKQFIRSGSLNLPAEYRLPFREIGLSIGLHAIERLQNLVEQSSNFADKVAVIDHIAALQTHLPLAEKIEKFWLEPEHQQIPSWIEHREINMVMLATSLLPDGFLQM